MRSNNGHPIFAKPTCQVRNTRLHYRLCCVDICRDLEERMTRDELLATLNAYRTIEAQCKELISYYEKELNKLDFAEVVENEAN